MEGMISTFNDGGAYYICDDDKLCLSYGFFVDAWMPLPERYREEERL